MYYQMNRSWEPLLSSHKPNFSPDYLGLICLDPGDGWEGVYWQLQLLMPEESQSAKKEVSTSLQHLQRSSWGKPQGCGRAKTGWLNCCFGQDRLHCISDCWQLSRFLKYIAFVQRQLLFLPCCLSRVGFLAAAFKMTFLPSV